MEQNPYQSPRVADSQEEQTLGGDPGSIRQLLTEIRDTQLEMLRLSREVAQRSRNSIWYRVPFSVVLILISFGFLFYSMYTRQRFLQQIPPRPAPRALP